MKTIIYSPFDALIKTPCKEVELEKDKSVTLNGIPNNILVYPTGKSKVLPFVITGENSPYYKIINKDNQSLVFLIEGFYCRTTERHHFSYNGIISDIEISTHAITFSNKTTKKEVLLTNPASHILCKNAFHINYVILEYTDKTHLILFNTINGKIRLYEGDKIIQDKNTFIISSDGHTTSIYIDKEGLKEKEKSGYKILTNPLFPAINFMNFIKEGDFTCARELLSPSLQEHQTEADLHEYFGQVSYIFPINHRTVFALSDTASKIYTFEIENGKIADINDE